MCLHGVHESGMTGSRTESLTMKAALSGRRLISNCRFACGNR